MALTREDSEVIAKKLSEIKEQLRRLPHIDGSQAGALTLSAAIDSAKASVRTAELVLNFIINDRP